MGAYRAGDGGALVPTLLALESRFPPVARIVGCGVWLFSCQGMTVYRRAMLPSDRRRDR